MYFQRKRRQVCLERLHHEISIIEHSPAVVLCGGSHMSTRAFITALICIVLLTALVLFAAVREDATPETYVTEMEG